MKKHFFSLAFLVAFFGLQAQDSLVKASFQREHLRLHRQSMQVLGSWAGLNLLGGLGYFALPQTAWGHFLAMNAYWNVVNLGLASWGLSRYHRNKQEVWNLDQTLAQSKKQSKIFWINAGLDLGYMAGGWALAHYGNSPQTQGFGHAIIAQGAFLLVFDGLMAWSHRRQRKKWLKPPAF